MANTSVVFITFFGLIASIFTLIVNIIMVCKTSIRKQLKNDLHLFFYRFVLDIFLGFFTAIYLILVLVDSYNPAILDSRSYFLFLFSLPASNVAAMRSIITLFITFDRFLAVYIPIVFHNKRQHFPSHLLAVLAVAFGLFEIPMLFIFCEFDLAIPAGCIAFHCAINTCFKSYWTTNKMTIFAFTGLFSILLCVKLACLGVHHKSKSKINRLAILDTITIAVFDFLPSFIGNLWNRHNPTSFKNVGPLGAMTKLFGCSIESYMATRTLIMKPEQKQSRWAETTRSRIAT